MPDHATDHLPRSSADLRHVYDDAYYTKHMAGHHLFASDQLTLKELTNVRRAYALMLHPSPSRVTDLGAGRGELARHLLARNVGVTILDYSEAAIELAKQHVGMHPLARFAVADAAEISDYVSPRSQDAIFLTDVVEHMSSAELQTILARCHDCLAPDGVVIIHTPEKHSGSVLTTSAVHAYHINLFDIASLRALLSETFEAVDVFTWNSIERFAETGRSIELFAYARKAPYAYRPVHMVESRVTSSGGQPSWFSARLTEGTSLPLRFLLRADLHVVRAPPDAIVQFIFGTTAPDRYFWTGFHVDLLIDNPAGLQIASEMTVAIGDPSWGDVDRITLRVRAPHGEALDVRINDVRLTEQDDGRLQPHIR